MKKIKIRQKENKIIVIYTDDSRKEEKKMTDARKNRKL